MKKGFFCDDFRAIIAIAWLLYGFVVLHLANIVRIIQLIFRVMGIEL
jgi:hypothetical protein